MVVRLLDLDPDPSRLLPTPTKHAELALGLLLKRDWPTSLGLNLRDEGVVEVDMLIQGICAYQCLDFSNGCKAGHCT